jgi:hypothetical protein
MIIIHHYVGVAAALLVDVVDTPPDQIHIVDALLADDLTLHKDILCYISHLVVVKVFTPRRLGTQFLYMMMGDSLVHKIRRLITMIIIVCY